ncbi:MAG TPA: GlsB/YeaQ/YmgE family stress response membrane protein [Anaerolineales bacterium]|nr:GlsB/YeaQ/YmgE family stress response membrane protein [Anaerolineales bacterium]
MNFITWLFVGSITGWLGGLIMRIQEQSNLQINIVVGIVGAFAAGVFITPLFDIETINQRAFSLPSMLVSLGGAVLLLTVVYLFRRFRTDTN